MTSTAGTQSIAYSIRYNFGKAANDIQIETYLAREGTGNVSVAVMINTFDTAATWGATSRPLRYAFSPVSRTWNGSTQIAPNGGVTDINPTQADPVYVSNSTPYAHGGEWWIASKSTANQMIAESDLSEATGLGRFLRLRTIYESGATSRTEQLYNPDLKSYSLDTVILSRNLSGGCAGGSGMVLLSSSWTYRLRQQLSTRP